MKRIFSILLALALALSALMVGSSVVLAWDGAATIRDETFYVASSQLTLGAWVTVYGGVQGNVIANPFQINLEYQAGILDSNIANLNTYMFPANPAYPPDHTNDIWLKNFSDNVDYVLRVNPAGGLTVYTYPDSWTVEPAIQWTLTGWHQTILAGTIVDHGDGTITLLVVPSGTYRPFPSDPPVNNVEVFSGQLACEVVGYRFTGTAGAIGAGSVLVPILAGSRKTTAETGTGNVSVTPSEGGIEGLTAVGEGSLPPAAQATKPINFPDGLFSFNIRGLSPGATVTVTITLPPGSAPTQYWKYQVPEGWIRIPMTIVGPPNVIRITLVDGGLGDDDGVANGVIVDQGGPGSGAVGWETYPISKVRVFLPWIALLAAIVAGVSLLVLRRRRTTT
jgi:hypothetical protein